MHLHDQCFGKFLRDWRILSHGVSTRIVHMCETFMLLGKQVVFTAELRRRLPGDCGIAVTAVHPGEVMTDVVRSLPALMQSAYRFFMRPFCLSPAEGAHPSHHQR